MPNKVLHRPYVFEHPPYKSKKRREEGEEEKEEEEEGEGRGGTTQRLKSKLFLLSSSSFVTPPKQNFSASAAAWENIILQFPAGIWLSSFHAERIQIEAQAKASHPSSPHKYKKLSLQHPLAKTLLSLFLPFALPLLSPENLSCCDLPLGWSSNLDTQGRAGGEQRRENPQKHKIPFKNDRFCNFAQRDEFIVFSLARARDLMMPENFFIAPMCLNIRPTKVRAHPPSLRHHAPQSWKEQPPCLCDLFFPSRHLEKSGRHALPLNVEENVPVG